MNHKFLNHLKPSPLNIIVEEYKPQRSGLIVAPEPTKDNLTLSKVIAIGCDVTRCKVGDVITFEQGRKAVIDGRTVSFIHELGVFAVHPAESLPEKIENPVAAERATG